MKIENRISQIIKDPEIYLYYYNEKYKTTVRTIDRLKEKKITPEALVHMRVVLGEMAGKRAISAAALEHKEEGVLIRSWYAIEKMKEDAELSFQNVNHFENFIMELEETLQIKHPKEFTPEYATIVTETEYSYE